MTEPVKLVICSFTNRAGEFMYTAFRGEVLAGRKIGRAHSQKEAAVGAAIMDMAMRNGSKVPAVELSFARWGQDEFPDWAQ